MARQIRAFRMDDVNDFRRSAERLVEMLSVVSDYAVRAANWAGEHETMLMIDDDDGLSDARLMLAEISRTVDAAACRAARIKTPRVTLRPLPSDDELMERIVGRPQPS